MRRKRSFRPQGQLKFLVIAVVLIVGLDYLMPQRKPPPVERPPIPAQEATFPEMPEPEKRRIEENPAAAQDPVPDSAEDTVQEIVEPSPLWIRNSVAFVVPADKPRIAIIIDDLGEDRKLTQEAMDFPAPVTMAFLPYPPGVKEQVAEARRKGHELLLHMPMEGSDPKLDSADYVLREDLTPAEFERILRDNMDAFSGYVGINNHMGSRLTRNREAMNIVMSALAGPGLLFVDSRTIGTSVAGGIAAEWGLAHAARDVFLDHDASPEGVRAALALVERTAREKGQAIAIGHPHDATYNALREWLPTIEEKGFVLVPVSAAVIVPPPRVEEEYP